MIFVIAIIFLGLIIGGTIALVKSINKDRSSAQNTLSINYSVLNKLKNDGFETSHICYMADQATAGGSNQNKQMLCVDTKAKKLAFVNYPSGSVTIVKFTDLINYDIYENGKTDTSGGVFYGAVIAESKEKCQELKLIIRIKSYEKPQIEYTLVSGTLFNDGIDKSQNQYRIIRNDLQQTVSYLEMILNENKAN